MEVGSVLSGRYEIKELVGEGGMSTVYRAYDTVLARTVAIKVLRDQYSSHAISKERFRKEALSAARLSHPNIVGVFDVGADENLNYIVMEFVSGKTLDQEMRGYRGSMPILKSIGIIHQVIDGLWHAHSHGLVHRDIKPHNILLSSDGRVKIADFGIARAASEGDLTQTGMVVGTVNYTSPEQAKGETATFKSDLYSTGVMLYEMLTGCLPFTGEGEVAVAIKHISEKPVPPRKLNPSISPMLERVIFKAMEKDASKRFQSAEEFKAALMKAEDGYLGKFGTDADLSELESSQTKTFSKVEGGGSPMPEGKKGGYDQKKGLKKLLILVAVFILVVAASALGLYEVWNNWMHVDEVVVPEVIGLSLIDAKVRLEEQTLTAEVVNSVYDKKIPADTVISQEPAAGTRRKVNSTIGLIISLGPDLGEVPDITGKDLREAGIIVEAAGFVIGENKLEYSMIVQEGLVIRQNPAPASKLDRGGAIIIVLSQGLPPTVVVPNVVGMDAEAAKEALTAGGLEVGLMVETASSDAPKGTVIGQTPPAGSEVDRGSAVDLKIAMEGTVTTGSESKKFEIKYTVPQETWIQEIIIKVSDTYGTRTVFGPISFKSGEEVTEVVEVFGTGRIEVWVDGNLYKAYDV